MKSCSWAPGRLSTKRRRVSAGELAGESAGVVVDALAGEPVYRGPFRRRAAALGLRTNPGFAGTDLSRTITFTVHSASYDSNTATTTVTTTRTADPASWWGTNGRVHVPVALTSTVAVLVPMALRSHDSATSLRSADRFGDAMRVLAEKDPSKLPWKELGVDVVLERCIQHGTALYALSVFDAWGVPTVNRYEVAEICGNKLLTTMRLIRDGVPPPK